MTQPSAVSPATSDEIAFAYLRDAPFVSLTTFRKNGTPVATPLWITALDDHLICWTPQTTAKVKRLRRDDRVQLQVCGRRGAVAANAPLLTGRAVVVEDPSTERRARGVLRAKYGREFDLITFAEKVIRRARPEQRVVLSITLDHPA